MSRHDRVRMSEAEVRAFVEAQQTLVLCSNGPGGVPHPMPMWYGLEPGGAVVMTTYAKSQKVRNLERDPRVSLLAEDGETYAELRGVVLYGRAELERDPERVLDALEQVALRNGGAGAERSDLREMLRPRVRKRIALRVAPERVVSWDHRKLGGG